MANKINKKTAKKIAKAAKKNKGLAVITILIVIAILAFVGYSGYKEKTNYESFSNGLKSIGTDITFDEEIISDITLPSLYKDYKINWETSNSNYVKLDGKVTRPGEIETDKEVTLTAIIDYNQVTIFYNIFKGIFGFEDSFSYEFKIKVKALEPIPLTDSDYVKLCLDGLYIPAQTFDNIGFNKDTCYENVKLSFESSNKLVIDDNGVVTTPLVDTVVTIKVTAKASEVSETREFNVTVLANNYSSYSVDDDFNSIDTTRNYQIIESKNVTYYNVKVIDEENATSDSVEETNEFPHNLRMRTDYKATDESKKLSYFETALLVNPKTFSFDYKFDGTQTTEKSSFKIYLKTTGDYEELLTQKIAINDEFQNINIDLSSYSSAQIKVEFIHEWSGESFVLIDNVKVNNKFSESDLDNSVSIITNVTKNIMLPFTTSFGGTVRWTSSDTNKITNNGALIEGASGKVTLLATITLGEINFTKTFEVEIVSKKAGSLTPVEIYFIDLGVYGLNDCGECTYIKYEDIDIVIDCGDHYDSTGQAITDVIDAHTTDKVIDYMILTHPDSDHIGGAPHLFDLYQVNNVYKFADETFTTKKFLNLKSSYDNEPNCNVIDVYHDIFEKKNSGSVDDKYEILTLSSDVYLKFINTGYLLDKETNGRSVVFELYAYDTRVLMTGDADNGGSHSKLESDYMNLVDDIDILKVCHHATENGTSTEFLEAVKPEVCVICNGNYLGNKHSHPNKAPLSRMDAYSKDLKIYAISGGGIHAEKTTGDYAYRGSCTQEESLIDRNGTITLTINDAGYSFECALKDEVMDLRESQYWSLLFK